MSGTEIRQLDAANGADYDEESARSSEQIAERFRREVIFGGFVSGRLHGIVTFLQQIPPKRRHVGMIWNQCCPKKVRAVHRNCLIERE